MRRETLRKKISALLMDTSEEHTMECFIQIGADEAQGLSTLELPTIRSAYQIPGDGVIYFEIEGYLEPVEFDELTKADLEEVYKKLSNQ